MNEAKNLDLDALAPEECAPRDLSIDDARALGEQLARDALPYARLVTCRRGPRTSVVVFDAEVELPQDPVHDIRASERIAVVFCTGDTKAPEVLALRNDFPGDVAHLNLRPWAFPKSLCMYDVQFRDVRAQWTPARFVASAREWLRQTARGELHGTDQPLEPLLGDWVGWIILPHALRSPAAETTDAGPAAVPLRIERLPDHRGKLVLVASLLDQPPARCRKHRQW